MCSPQAFAHAEAALLLLLAILRLQKTRANATSADDACITKMCFTNTRTGPHRVIDHYFEFWLGRRTRSVQKVAV